MSRFVKKIGLIFAAFVLVLSSLSFVRLTTVKAAEAGTAKITIGTIKNASAVPAVMGKLGHEYNDHNIEVDIKSFDTNKELNDAISQGTVNVAITDLVSYASIANKNTSWKVVGTMPGYYGLVANKKYKSIKSLKGKTIAIDKNDSSKMYLKDLLKKNKMKLSSVKLSQVDSENDRVAAIKSGNADAAVAEDAALSQAKADKDKLLNKQSSKKDNGSVIIMDKKFSSKNTSSSKILLKTINSQIKTINSSDSYMLANDSFRQWNVSSEAAAELNKEEVSFPQIHKVKKADFNKAMKYAKSQKLYSGKISYKKSVNYINYHSKKISY